MSAFMLSSICYAQDRGKFGKMPEFLAYAGENELVDVFGTNEFIRFSSTFPKGIIVAYENSEVSQRGSLDEIKDQISIFRERLKAAKRQKPEVSFFSWTDCKERIEVYPCGVIAVYRNNKITHVWLDIE